MPNGPDIAAVFAGGALGGTVRTVLADHFAAAPGTWPWVTFLVNVAGAALLGVVAARLDGADRRRPFWAVGVCGGLTTFSAMQVELVRMLAADRVGLAVGYAAASLVAGLAACHVAGDLAGGARESERDGEVLQ